MWQHSWDRLSPLKIQKLQLNRSCEFLGFEHFEIRPRSVPGRRHGKWAISISYERHTAIGRKPIEAGDDISVGRFRIIIGDVPNSVEIAKAGVAG